jgi:hypothetical protein
MASTLSTTAGGAPNFLRDHRQARREVTGLIDEIE